MKLYRRFDVFVRRDSETVVVYRCFEDLDSRRFSIQSADRMKRPFDAEQSNQHVTQLFELFAEESPESRSGSFPTVAEAILDFEQSFE